MPARACIVWLKGDWSEYCGTFGFPTWQDTVRPCYVCNARPETLYSFEELSPAASPWRANTDDDYHAACARCELLVEVSEEDHGALLLLLDYEKRQAGSRGLALTEDFNSLGLKVGDRLKPSQYLANVHDLASVTDFPKQLLFWRRARETSRSGLASTTYRHPRRAGSGARRARSATRMSWSSPS